MSTEADVKNLSARPDETGVCISDHPVADSALQKAACDSTLPVSENTSEDLENFLRRIYEALTRQASFPT